jgi:hypothetical protein
LTVVNVVLSVGKDVLLIVGAAVLIVGGRLLAGKMAVLVGKGLRSGGLLALLAGIPERQFNQHKQPGEESPWPIMILRVSLTTAEFCTMTPPRRQPQERNVWLRSN